MGVIVGLWSYAFRFWAIWTLGCSFAVVVVAFVYAHKHPASVLVDAAAGQLSYF